MGVMCKLPVALMCRGSARLCRRANQKHRLAYPASMQRGVTADRHETWDGMRWTRERRVRMRSQGEEIRERSREARKTSGIVADGEVVWSWHPLLMSSRAEVTSAQPGADETFQSAWRRWQKEFVTGESAKEPVKTIAWGMPDVSGASAVNTRAHTYYQ